MNSWKYALILVHIEDEGEDIESEICELVELYVIDGSPAYCKARINSPEELRNACNDVDRDGINRWFYENGAFTYVFDEEVGQRGWDWRPH